MPARRRLTFALVAMLVTLACGPLGAASAATQKQNPVIVDCLAHPSGLTGHYTVDQLRHALQVMPPTTREYTSCPDVINRALLAAVGSGNGTSGGTGGGSGSFLPTPVIVILVLLILAAVTFGALAVRRRRAEAGAGGGHGTAQARVMPADDPDAPGDEA
jgi:hypothetical protein